MRVKIFARLIAVAGIAVLAAAAFTARGLALEQWYLWKLASKDQAERKLAAAELGAMRSRRAIPRLVEMLQENILRALIAGSRAGEVAWRVNEGWRLKWELSAEIPSWVDQEIIEPIPDREEWWEHCWVGQGLARIGSLAIPEILRSTDWKDEDSRFVYSMVLARMGSGAVPEICRQMDGGDAPAKCLLLTALARMGPEARVAAPAVLRALRDEDRTVRLRAVHALSRIDPGFRDALEAFFKDLRGEWAGILVIARFDLQSFPETVQEVTVSILDASRQVAVAGDSKEYQTKLQSICDFWAQGVAAVPALEAMLVDSDLDIVFLAAKELERIRTGSSEDECSMPSLLSLAERVRLLLIESGWTGAGSAEATD